MKTSTCFASVAALLAMAAFTQKTALKSAPAAQPLLRPAAVKSTKKVAQTATVSDVVAAANAFVATLTTAQQTTLLQAFKTLRESTFG